MAYDHEVGIRTGPKASTRLCMTRAVCVAPPIAEGLASDPLLCILIGSDHLPCYPLITDIGSHATEDRIF
jgi:hypothetical protein